MEFQLAADHVCQIPPISGITGNHLVDRAGKGEQLSSANRRLASETRTNDP